MSTTREAPAEATNDESAHQSQSVTFVEPPSVWRLTLALSSWLDVSVIPGTLLFIVIIAPAFLYWMDFTDTNRSPINVMAFFGAMACGAYVANQVANRKIKKARSIASLQHLTDLDATTLKHILGFIPPWVSYPDMMRVTWLNVLLEKLWPFIDKAMASYAQVRRDRDRI